MTFKKNGNESKTVAHLEERKHTESNPTQKQRFKEKLDSRKMRFPEVKVTFVTKPNAQLQWSTEVKKQLLAIYFIAQLFGTLQSGTGALEKSGAVLTIQTILE